MRKGNGSVQQREALAYAAELVQRAGALIITAGAGIGVDSGLPDFRGSEGFWRAYPALREAGLNFEDMASAARFDSDPYRAWGFYGHRLGLYRKTVPHSGFTLMKNWALRKQRGYAVFTSNVDGQFLRAGFGSDHLNECHGSIHYLQCTVPCTAAIWSAEHLDVDIDETNCTWRGDLPTCPHCGGLARPNILMFSDSRWVPARIEQQGRRLADWVAGINAPVVIEIGAGKGLPTVREFGQRMAKERNGSLIRINPDAGADDDADVVIAMPALRALQAIDRLLNLESPSGVRMLRSPARKTAPPSAFTLDEANGIPAEHIQDEKPVKKSSRTGVGKKHAEQTLRRRLALLALLPDSGGTGIGIRVLTEKLNDAGYPCVRRTVERDLREITDGGRAWSDVGIEIVANPDPSNAHASLWVRKTPAKSSMLRLPSSENALLIGLLAQELQAFLPVSALNPLSPDRLSSARLMDWPGSDDHARFHQKICSLPEGPAMCPPQLDARYFREINEALLRDEQIELRYLASSRDAEGAYRLHPVGIVKKGRFFWLVAATEEYGKILKDVRSFRMDRVRGVQRRLNERVSATLPSLSEILGSGVLEYFPAGMVELVLRFRPGQAGDQLMINYTETPLSKEQSITMLVEGGHQLRATVPHTRELVWMLQAQAHLAEVMAPADLRQELQLFAAQASEQYRSSPT